jgi:lysophospholipase L1-like esterase
MKTPPAPSRRDLLRLAGLGLLGTIPPATAAAAVVPRGHLLATMLTANTASSAVAAGQTLCQLWAVPDDITAIGVIVLNDTAAPWSLARVIAAPSRTAYGQDGGLGNPAAYLNPSGPAEWINITWHRRGRLNPAVVANSDQLGFTVPPNTQPDPTLGLIGSPETSTGQQDAAPEAPGSRNNVPNFHYSDLVPLAQPARYIMTRVLFTTAQPAAAVRGVSCHPRWIGSLPAAGWEWTTRSSATDIVTAPPAVATGEWNGFSPIVGLTYLTRRPGVLLVSGGDSHFDGTTTSVAFNNFAFLAARQANHPGVCPVGYMNLAMGGRSSNTFWPVLNRIVDALHPGIVLLQSWTANDGGASPQAEDKYWDRLSVTMEAVRGYGGVPVMVTPFPRDPKAMANPAVRAGWQAARARVLAMGAAGAPIVDAGAQVGARDADGLTGTYRTDIAASIDAIHPDDLGHALIAGAAAPVISKLLAQ